MNTFVLFLAKPLELFRWLPHQQSPRSPALLLASLLAILAWQLQFAMRPDSVSSEYKVTNIKGLAMQQPLVYFLYYMGVYPVATNPELYVFNKEAALDLVAKHGDQLMMEWGNPIFSAVRLGDYVRILLYLPDAWLKGAPVSPSVIPSNIFGFIFSLCVLWTSFWWIGLPLLGTLLVLFFGSNPFQLNAVYVQENVFGWGITVCLILLALHAPLFGVQKRSPRYLFSIPIIAGIVLGTLHHIRSEGVTMIISCIASYVFLKQRTKLSRLTLIALFLLAFGTVDILWSGYFAVKIERAKHFVAAHGGHPHPVPNESHHNFWLPVWDGLGDFDAKYGHEWNDRKAHAMVKDVLEKKYNYKFPRWNSDSYFFEDEFWDAAKKYPKLPYEVPRYHSIIRKSVLDNIARDPMWYLQILLRRARRILTELTPIQIQYYKANIAIPWSISSLICLLLVLVYLRNQFLISLAWFALPLCFLHCSYSLGMVCVIIPLTIWWVLLFYYTSRPFTSQKR